MVSGQAVLWTLPEKPELEGLHTKPLRVAGVKRAKPVCSRQPGGSSRAWISCAKLRKVPRCRDRASTPWLVPGSVGLSSGGSSSS